MAIRTRAAQGLVAAAVLGWASAAQAATAAELFYQRALMSAADAACRLFAPPVAASLAAAKAQARGAALRSGASAAQLGDLEARAGAAAAAQGCGSPQLQAGASRVRAAFDGYARLDRLEFPGEIAGWTAERPPDDAVARWRVFQTARFGWDLMRFGLVGRTGARPLMAIASFADGAEPAAARLVMRDARLTSGPYLDARAADLAGRLPLDARLPPRGASVVYQAEAMSSAGRDLTAPGMASAWAFRFPPAAVAALAALDPREAVAVEFVFADGADEGVRVAYVEVGDFAAATAFQSIAQR